MRLTNIQLVDSCLRAFPPDMRRWNDETNDDFLSCYSEHALITIFGRDVAGAASKAFEGEYMTKPLVRAFLIGLSHAE